jgi:hypothetical protein
MTLEALVLHFIDDLDSKINQFRNQRRRSPLEIQFLKGLGRYVYLPAGGEPVEGVLPEPGPEPDEAEGPGAEGADEEPALF